MKKLILLCILTIIVSACSWNKSIQDSNTLIGKRCLIGKDTLIIINVSSEGYIFHLSNRTEIYKPFINNFLIDTTLTLCY